VAAAVVVAAVVVAAAVAVVAAALVHPWATSVAVVREAVAAVARCRDRVSLDPAPIAAAVDPDHRLVIPALVRRREI
jgi:hypothetical protein